MKKNKQIHILKNIVSLLLILFVFTIIPFKSQAFVSFPNQIDTLQERKNIQTVLNNVMNPSPNLVVDGVLGRKSIQAIQAFQDGRGLVPDGKVGPITRSALENAQKVDTNTTSSNQTRCSNGAVFDTATGQPCALNINTTSISNSVPTSSSSTNYSSGVIIANHNAVTSFDKGEIPACWINEVKTKSILYPGESHAGALPYGLRDLESINSTYAFTEAPSKGQEHWLCYSDNGEDCPFWQTTNLYCKYCGEQHVWTTPSATSGMIKAIGSMANSGYKFDVFEWMWSWDMSAGNASSIDPIYNTRWYGETVGGPQGNLPFGLDSGDTALTGNSLSLENYFSAINKIKSSYPSMSIVYTTGVVDDGGYQINTGERGYQRYLKNEAIRKYVKDNNLYLFDIADIITYNNSNVSGSDIWIDNGGVSHKFPFIHPDNYEGTYTGHIGSVGALRLAKAHWWLMARITGWNGLPSGFGGNSCY
jgi:peptidoglycan hydrolase-like protein with peptidoglycan-binding domain